MTFTSHPADTIIGDEKKEGQEARLGHSTWRHRTRRHQHTDRRGVIRKRHRRRDHDFWRSRYRRSRARESSSPLSHSTTRQQPVRGRLHQAVEARPRFQCWRTALEEAAANKGNQRRVGKRVRLDQHQPRWKLGIWGGSAVRETGAMISRWASSRKESTMACRPCGSAWSSSATIGDPGAVSAQVQELEDCQCD
jgi:hypothetical protein